MSKGKKKSKKSRPLPKSNWQIPNSMIRPMTTIGVSPFLPRAREYPFHGCWIMEGWKEAGITPVVVARLQENERIMFGVYMVDLYCLGIKDAYAKADYSLNRFERELPELCSGDPIPCSIELAHEVIYGALEYAAKLGFQPHPDFSRLMADLMLDPPEVHPRVNHVPYGKDGKPFYMSGPFDDEQKSRQVFNTLMRTCGEGNFHYLVGLDGMPD